MRHPGQIISGYVALCLALAGLAGVSPWLHVRLEHGGQAELHSHRGGVAHSHAVPSEHELPPGVFVPAGADKKAPDRPAPHDHRGLVALLTEGLMEGSLVVWSVPLPVRWPVADAPLPESVPPAAVHPQPGSDCPLTSSSPAASALCDARWLFCSFPPACSRRVPAGRGQSWLP